MRDPEFIELRNRFLIGLMVALFVGGLLIIIFYRSLISERSKVYNQLRSDDTVLLFVEDNNCDRCIQIKNILDNKRVEYYIYNRDSDVERDSIEKVLKIDNYSIEIPALMYVKNGKVKSFLSDAEDIEEINDFIDNYGGD